MRKVSNLFKFCTAPNKSVHPLHFDFAKNIPLSVFRSHQNLFQAVNSAMDIALETDPTYSIDPP